MEYYTPPNAGDIHIRVPEMADSVLGPTDAPLPLFAMVIEAVPPEIFFQERMTAQKPNLAFFLELGGSLEEWNDVGFFSREISLYNRLAREYCETIYIFTYGSEKDRSFSVYLEKNIVVIPRGRRSKNYFNNFLYEISMPFRQWRILKQCDIFKTNQNSGGIAASIAKILFPSKKLVIRSGYIGSELARRSKLSLVIKTYYFFAERLSYFLCDQAFIPMRINYDILLRKYPFLKKKTQILNNFIDTDLFHAESSERRYDIIYVARFDRDKNHRAILEALRETNASILFIGKGPERDDIEFVARKYKLPLFILDAIPNNELPRYYNSAKICAFSSLHEGCPKSLLEAMSCEIPIVALDSPGVSNIVQNEKNGLIGPESSFQSNLFRLLNDPVLRDTLGKSGRKTILAEYSFDILFKKEIEVYKKLFNL